MTWQDWALMATVALSAVGVALGAVRVHQGRAQHELARRKLEAWKERHEDQDHA